MKEQPQLPPTILVIFGITGDLSRRYLLPALNEVSQAGQLPQQFKIVGVTRQSMTKEQFVEAASSFPKAQTALKNLADNFDLMHMDLSVEADYQVLKARLEEQSGHLGSDTQFIFYLVVPPDNVLPIINQLAKAGLNQPNSKLLLEKPFGRDLESAKTANQQIGHCFKEEQVYRIDHYLAKEMAQNIAVFLSSNALFRDVWNNQFIEQVEVVAAEQIGIEGRVGFYESTGALRDFVQSHLLQLAALTIMEPCSSLFEFAELPQRRLAALRSLSLDETKPLVRAQYEGYKTEVNSTQSTIETFVSLCLKSTADRWQGIPIRLISGKNLDKKMTEIHIDFKKSDSAQANRLTLRIQPDEGVELDLWVKQPGYDRNLQKLPLKFNYQQHFDHLPDAYEQVLVDVMRSDQSLFASSSEVIESWRILASIQAKWQSNSKDLFIYQKGSTIDEVLAQAQHPV